MKKQTIIALAVLAAFTVSVSGCKNYKEKKEAAAASQAVDTEEKVYPVRAAQAASGRIESHRTFGADVVAAHTKAILPTTTGEVKEFYIEEGDTVKKGQVVAILDRSKPGLTYKPSEVYAPIDGTVIQVSSQVGAQASPAASMGTVVSSGDIEIKFDVAEALLYAVHVGDRVTVTFDAYPGETFNATITKMSGTISVASRTRRITCVLDQPDDRIIVGMYGRVRVLMQQADDAVLVPRSAVTNGHVFIVDNTSEGQVARQRNVTTGISSGGSVQITDGLAPGETVVTEGLNSLADGTRITVLEN